MSDLIERLRKFKNARIVMDTCAEALCREAADTLEAKDRHIEELKLLELFQDITEELLTNSKLMRDALQKIIDEDDSYDLTATVIAEKALAAVEEEGDE